MAFPHWFTGGYAQYGKNKNVLPVDQNLLLASIAPKKLYVVSTDNDPWSYPQGAFDSLKFTKVFALYDAAGVLPEEMETYLPVGEANFSHLLGIHIRTGGHDINADDWKHYLNYMDTHFVKEETRGYPRI